MAVARMDWRLAQAMPLGLGPSSHGFTAPGGRSVALQVSRQATQAHVGPLDFQIHVSDVVGLDGQLLHQQVVLQAVQRDEDLDMLQYIAEGDEGDEGAWDRADLKGPWEMNGPGRLLTGRGSGLAAHCLRGRHSVGSAGGSFTSCSPGRLPSLLGLRSPFLSHLAPSSPSANRASLPSPFNVHPQPSSASLTSSQAPMLPRAPTLRRSLSRAPNLGWSAFVPSFPCSSDAAHHTSGAALTRAPTFARAPTLGRTPSFARRTFLRMSSTTLGRSASTLARSASICMRVGGPASNAVQSQALAAAPSLAGAVGVVAMLQEAWRAVAARAAADAAHTSATLLSTGKVMEEAGGALSTALVSAAELSTTLDAVAHSLHASGAAEAAGALHTTVGALQASGAALVAAGGALQAVGRWGLLHSGPAEGSTTEVVRTVESVKSALDSVDGAVQSLGSLKGVVSTLVSATSVGGDAAVTAALITPPPVTANAVAGSVATAVTALSGSAVTTATAAASTAVSRDAAVTGAVPALSSAAALSASPPTAALPSITSVLPAGVLPAGVLPAGVLPAGVLPPTTTGFGPVDQAMGVVGALKAAVDAVPGAVVCLAEGLHGAGDVLQATGDALSSMEDGHIQVVGRRVRDTARALQSAGRRVRTAADAAGSTIESVKQHAVGEVEGAVRQLAQGGEVCMEVIQERVREVVSEHMARLAGQLQVLAVRNSGAFTDSGVMVAGLQA